MGEDAGAALFGRAVAVDDAAAVHGLGGAVARHAPAVALAAARNLVFKVGDADVCGHFEAGDEGVAGGAVVALGAASAAECEAAGFFQLLREERLVLDKYLVDMPCGRGHLFERSLAAAPVDEVGQPFEAYEPGFAGEEFAVGAPPFGDDGTFPLPRAGVFGREPAFFGCVFFDGEALHTVAEEREEAPFEGEVPPKAIPTSAVR